MKLYWSFQRGGEVLEKIPSVGEVWIFSGTTQIIMEIVELAWCLMESGTVKSDVSQVKISAQISIDQMNVVFSSFHNSSLSTLNCISQFAPTAHVFCYCISLLLGHWASFCFTWKMIAAYLKGFSNDRRMAIFLGGISFSHFRDSVFFDVLVLCKLGKCRHHHEHLQLMW